MSQRGTLSAELADNLNRRIASISNFCLMQSVHFEKCTYSVFPYRSDQRTRHFQPIASWEQSQELSCTDLFW